MLLRLSVIAMMSLLSAGLSAAQATAKDLTAEQFMSIVRNPPGRDSWAKMEGYAMHKREGARPVKAQIRMGTLFTPERTIAQITFNKNEVYNIGQTYGENPHGKRRICPRQGADRNLRDQSGRPHHELHLLET